MQESYLKYIPEPLLDDIIGDCCIPIIGAGFSKNGSFPPNLTIPLWNDLGKYFSKKLPEYPFSTPVDAISEFSHEFSRVKLIEELRKVLLLNDAKPGNTHISFANLQFNIIVTTNIDFLLEKAYDQIKRGYRVIMNESQLSIRMGEADTVILKIHGDVDNPDRLVMTENDYDMFLTKYPLISTSLSNLLISKTPLFIGYSLEDPDYRHLWNILGDRLGNLRRPGYTILVNPSPFEIAKYNRRGIKVIELPGKKENYGEILTSLFQELYDYWDEGVIKESVIIDDEILSELLLPRDSQTRLCYFAIPLKLHSYYKKYIFPIAQRYSFTPITGMDIKAPGDNIIPKLSLLFERASIIIVDLSDSAILSKLTSETLENKKILIISDNELQTPIYSLDKSIYNSLVRPVYPEPPDQEFNDNIDKIFKKYLFELKPILYKEPKRLLENKEYNAAITIAISLIQTELKEILKTYFQHLKIEVSIPLENVFELALKNNIITDQEFNSISDWKLMRERITYFHEESINFEQANSIVYGVEEILETLNKTDMFIGLWVIHRTYGLTIIKAEITEETIGKKINFNEDLIAGFLTALIDFSKEVGFETLNRVFEGEVVNSSIFEFEQFLFVFYTDPRANITLMSEEMQNYFQTLVKEIELIIPEEWNLDLRMLLPLRDKTTEWLKEINKKYREKLVKGD